MPHTRIKFCGLTRAEDVRLAVELGVDYIGLVFASRSPRKLLLGQGRMLRELVPEEIAVVALVMDNTAVEVEAVLENIRPDLLQFHGAEDDATCAAFAVPFFKAIAMGGGAAVLDRVAAYPSAHGYLFDGHAEGEQGGSGQRFDWKRLPRDIGRPSLLAGGLNGGNVALAIANAQPWGVDVSSGIESAPGLKDAEKMRHFMDQARRADSLRV
ncbi:MAG: phosphoribosylanthranilate isomerase [Pseudoxanthomonas sp.]